ncbi:MAG: hypothetical protein A2X08_11060 [Bacteroidetes bacterium GWA2_32_17]|nr:MAG: hypothetical protein A2X08_11060 [Bacteroidetes bacterium GWA2_32_17]
MITQQQIGEVINSIVTLYQPEKIILFGSYANGTATENSDLDLLVVKKSEMPRYKRGIELRKILRPFKFMFPLDILVFTKDELYGNIDMSYSFTREILANGKIVYDK